MGTSCGPSVADADGRLDENLLPEPDPYTRLLAAADLEALRRELLQIRAQATQIMPAHSESRPRGSLEAGAALGVIAARLYQSARHCEQLLGLPTADPNPGSADPLQRTVALRVYRAGVGQ